VKGPFEKKEGRKLCGGPRQRLREKGKGPGRNVRLRGLRGWPEIKGAIGHRKLNSRGFGGGKREASYGLWSLVKLISAGPTL